MNTSPELLPGAWSPDVIVKLECRRHGQHDAISRTDRRCQLCHDANRPGVIERRYVSAAASVAVEAAAHELYAAGPWGPFITFLDGGARCGTDAHNMDVYREMARLVIDTATQ